MITIEKKDLKYLFTACFDDGSVIEQTPEDKSELDPEKRSQFFDVLERSRTTRLLTFALRGEGHLYVVDLRDGHFEIDGVPFRMHEDDPGPFEIIFWRNHTHNYEQSRTKITEVSHDVVYRIGWKALGNQSYQRVLQID